MARSNGNILQWNLRGFRSRRDEVKHLINKFSPAAFCIQEVKIQQDRIEDKEYKRNFIDIKGHNSYFNCNETPHGGVGIYVRDTYAHSPIQLDTTLQAVAVRLSIGKKTYSLCSIYLPPSDVIDVTELQNLKKQLPPPYIFLGDFNGHNTLWGSPENNTRGEIIEKFLQKEDLVLFNNKKHT